MPEPYVSVVCRAIDSRPRPCVQLPSALTLSYLDRSEAGEEKKLSSSPGLGQDEESFEEQGHGD